MTRRPRACDLRFLAVYLEKIQPGGEYADKDASFKRALLEGAVSSLLDRCGVPTPLYDAECERRMAAQLEQRLDKAS